MPKSEKGDNSAKYLQNLAKTLDTHILAQEALQIFCWQGFIGLQCNSQKRGIALQWQVRRKRKVYGSAYFSCYSIIKFQDPISNRSWPYAKRNGRTDRQAQTSKKLRGINNHFIIVYKVSNGLTDLKICYSIPTFSILLPDQLEPSLRVYERKAINDWCVSLGSQT